MLITTQCAFPEELSNNNCVKQHLINKIHTYLFQAVKCALLYLFNYITLNALYISVKVFTISVDRSGRDKFFDSSTQNSSNTVKLPEHHMGTSVFKSNLNSGLISGLQSINLVFLSHSWAALVWITADLQLTCSLNFNLGFINLFSLYVALHLHREFRGLLLRSILNSTRPTMTTTRLHDED